MSATVNVKGLNDLIAKTKAISADSARMANAIVSSTCDTIVADAKQAAPADLGTIRQNIGKEQVGDASFALFSNAPESPFQEFGTGPMVDVPAEYEDIAATFKGDKGDGWEAFIESLMGWIKRHGLAGVYSVKTHKLNNHSYKDQNEAAIESAAWAIARSIIRDGLSPQPFFFPAIDKGIVALDEKMKTYYDSLISSQ